VGANGGAGIVNSERSLTISMGDLRQEPTPQVAAAEDRDARTDERPAGSGPAPYKDRPEGEHVVAEERHAADDERAGEAAQPAESERVAHPSREATDVKNWDLYVVEYPPDDEGSAPGSEDDEFDSSRGWALYGADSERGSVNVGVNGETDVVWEHQRTA
jgi:hypothetical protein